MKEISYLIKKIKKNDPAMLLMMFLYGIFAGLRPFIRILGPTYVIKNAGKGGGDLKSFFIFLALLSLLSAFLSSFLQGNFRMRKNSIRYGLIEDLISYSLDLDYGKLDSKETQNELTAALRAVSNSGSGGAGIIDFLFNFFSLLLSAIGFLWIFSRLPLGLLLIFLALTLLGGLFLKQVANLKDLSWEEEWNYDRENDRLIYEFRSPKSKKDILIYDFIGLGRSYFTYSLGKIIENRRYFNKKVVRTFVYSRSIFLLRDLLVFYRLGREFFAGGMELSDFYLLLSSIIAFIGLIDQVALNFSEFKENRGIFQKYMALIPEEFEEKEEEDVADLEEFELEFKNVSFVYPGMEKPALKNLSFTIKDGEALAVVGENGAGKSTLALLICGFYKPTSGQILLNGRDLEDLDKDLYRRYISAIFQDPAVFPFTIRENVVLGEDFGDLDKTYQESGLDQVLEKYEKGDQEVLLRILDDGGIDLSGGQMQRLFLARALNKKSAAFYILDEPTAQLDALAEKDLYQTYKTYLKGKSSVFISHRLASTKFCDRIIYLKDGEIIEEGSHDDLIKKDGAYRELFEIQAKNYREGVKDEKHF